MLRLISLRSFLLCGLLFLPATVWQVRPSSAQQTNYYSSANFWLPKCQAPIGSGDMAECIGFFTGWEAAIKLMGGSGVQLNSAISYCPPHGTTFMHAINIVLAYARRYPGQGHLEFGSFVAAALNEAFPCRR